MRLHLTCVPRLVPRNAVVRIVVTTPPARDLRVCVIRMDVISILTEWVPRIFLVHLFLFSSATRTRAHTHTHTHIGTGGSFDVDTTKPFQVVTQFITSDGTDSGDLVEIKRIFVQNGKILENPNATLSGLEKFNSVTDEFCNAQKTTFGDENIFEKKGGLKALGEALDRGMVLVMSLWDDHAVDMLWLDSKYPVNGTKPGTERGPCDTSSGKPEDVESQSPDATVVYGDIRVGTIGSTFKPSPTPGPSPTPTPTPSGGCPGGDLSSCIGLCPSNPAAAYKACVQECVTRCS